MRNVGELAYLSEYRPIISYVKNLSTFWPLELLQTLYEVITEAGNGSFTFRKCAVPDLSRREDQLGMDQVVQVDLTPLTNSGSCTHTILTQGMHHVFGIEKK